MSMPSRRNTVAPVREVDRRQLDVLVGDVLPDVELGPVREREHADVLTLAVPAVVERPDLGALVLRVPLAELVAEREEALLGARLLLVAAGAAHHRVEPVLLDRVEQRRGLQPVARRAAAACPRRRGPRRSTSCTDATTRLTSSRSTDGVAELDDLGEVVAGVDVHHRERAAARARTPSWRGAASRRCPCRPRTAAPAARTRPRPRAGDGSTRIRARRDERSADACVWFGRPSVRAQASGQPCSPHSILPCPAQRPERGSSPSCDRTGARPAPDRRVALRRERVLEELVVLLVGRDVGVGPRRERVDLHDAAADVEVHDRRRSCASATRPGANRSSTPACRASARASGSTLRIAQHSSGSVCHRSSGDDERLHDREVQVVALAHALDVPERLREVVLRVEEHDLDAGRGLAPRRR